VNKILLIRVLWKVAFVVLWIGSQTSTEAAVYFFTVGLSLLQFLHKYNKMPLDLFLRNYQPPFNLTNSLSKMYKFLHCHYSS
jgi:hypothetical protein